MHFESFSQKHTMWSINDHAKEPQTTRHSRFLRKNPKINGISSTLLLFGRLEIPLTWSILTETGRGSFLAGLLRLHCVFGFAPFITLILIGVKCKSGKILVFCPMSFETVPPGLQSQTRSLLDWGDCTQPNDVSALFFVPVMQRDL